MKNGYFVRAAVLAVCMICSAAPFDAAAAASPGEQAFTQNCAVCHPQGGNIINTAKTLNKKVLAAGGIREAADIVKQMRNPGPGMTKFDEKAIPDQTANAIAEYILKTFK